MATMNLEQLRKLREEIKQDMSDREAEGREIQVIVGMGTCGIAAGAKRTFDAVVEAVRSHGLSDRVVIRRTGCMGLCYVEPTVEVVMPGMPRVIYGNIDPDTAKDMIRKHLVERRLLDNHLFDRPSADIVNK
jgi:NADP-reducing hydrogenase subunit HndB